MTTKDIMITDDRLMDSSEWLNFFRSFPQLVRSSEDFKIESGLIYGGRMEGRGAMINMTGTSSVPIGAAGFLYINIKTESNKVPTVSDILFSETLPINDEAEFDHLQTHIDNGEIPQEIVVKNELNIVLYEIDDVGSVVEDYRNRDLKDTLYAHWLLGVNPDTGEEMNFDEIINYFNDKINELTGGGLTVDLADNRYERALNINNNYSNEDLTGLNMAQIVNLFSTAMGASMAEDLGANTVVGSGGNVFTNLNQALGDLINEFYGITTTLTDVLTFRYEAVYGKNTTGGQMLEVTINQGATFQFQYDNYGDNWETVNADAFQPKNVYFGKVDITNIVRAQAFELNGTIGGRFIRGATNITSVTDASFFIDLDYASGNTMFRVGRSGGSAGTRYTYISSHTGAGIEEGALRIYHDTTNKVNHRVNGIGHQLAYLSDTTRSLVRQLQYQRSSELITIDSIEGVEPEMRTARLTKELSARKALVNDIEQSIVNELKTVVASFVIDDELEVDIWDVEPMNKLKNEVLAEIWARYESEE